MPSENVVIRPMEERDLEEADRVTRLAFGTFLGLPDPMKFMGDASFIHTRWKADPSSAIVAESAGEIVGSSFVTTWGSAGFFGPLTVRPDYWDKGVAQKLLRETVGKLDRADLTVAGLFTFANSTKHLHLYQKFGFWPQRLSALMTKTVTATSVSADWSSSRGPAPAALDDLISECRELTDHVYPGLDLGREIRALKDQNLGELVLLRENGRLVGMAICHEGPGSEAGTGTCYIKFGAVEAGEGAGDRFENLLAACEAAASAAGLGGLFVGVNTAQNDAYRRMLAGGFRIAMTGVLMQKADHPGYYRRDSYILSDWR